MAILAGDLSQRNVSPVREVGMVGYSMYLNPGDRLIFLYVGNQFLLFFAVRHRFFMAVLAKINIGNRGFLVGEYLGVTVETAKSHFGDMLIMIVCNRLGNTFGIRTTCYEKQNDDGRKANPERLHYSSEAYRAVFFPFHGENDLRMALISPGMQFFTPLDMPLSRSISRERPTTGNGMEIRAASEPASLSESAARHIQDEECIGGFGLARGTAQRFVLVRDRRGDGPLILR
jgi:hypothetical protein